MIDHVHMIEEETFIWQDSSVLAGNHLFSIVAMIRDRHNANGPITQSTVISGSVIIYLYMT